MFFFHRPNILQILTFPLPEPIVSTPRLCSVSSFFFSVEVIFKWIVSMSLGKIWHGLSLSLPRSSFFCCIQIGTKYFLVIFFFRRLVECFGALNVCAKHTHTLICIGYITVTTVQKSRRRQLFDIVELSSIGDCIELNNNGKKTKQISRKFSWAHEMYTANGEWSKLMRAARESRMLVPFFLILSHNIFPTSNPRSVPLLFYVC